jgi:2-methylcitrate dehydratase PrpD
MSLNSEKVSQTGELTLVKFLRQTTYDQIPPDAVAVVKQILMAVIGAAIGGAAEEGCGPLREMLVDRGGKPEATVLIYGDKLPAPSAALLNGVMCRALDFCDAMIPGLHMGSSLIPAALAAAELRSGCDGREFITALTVGAEIGSRLNLTEETYDGFDPTGVAGVFAATAAAARILELDEEQTLHALALAFNRCGGSFQSNVDGCLAVRVIQGWVAESAVHCALLAKSGITGPVNFLDGIYGYLHLFGRDRITSSDLTSGLGNVYHLKKTVFKKFPSCGATQSATELALQAIADLNPKLESVASAEVRLPPYTYRLVGHQFDIGRNARVNAQFSVRFCVANALVRGASTLVHFREEAVQAPELRMVIDRIKVVSDENLIPRGHTAVDLTISTTDGRRAEKKLDIAPGFPGNELTVDEHRSRFAQCLEYAERPLSELQAAELLESIDSVERTEDVRSLLRLLVVQ